jgi:hypothetical protein
VREKGPKVVISAHNGKFQSEVSYYPIDSALSDKIRDLAKRHGISPQTLLNLWVQERLQEEKVG